MVISGFSGAGKGTLVKKLLSEYDNYALSISMTTRGPREGEQDGREYFFRTKEQFEENIAKNGFIEYAQYCGNYYGTPKAYVEEQMQAGKDVILEIEIQGAMKIKEQFPESLLLFVTPPSAKELQKRLVGRGTETADVIAQRLARAYEESEGMHCGSRSCRQHHQREAGGTASSPGQPYLRESPDYEAGDTGYHRQKGQRGTGTYGISAGERGRI